MSDKLKTTRKHFLRLSGLAFIGGLLFTGKHSSASKTSEPVGTTGDTQSLAKFPRVRSAQHSVVRESV